MRHVIKLSEEKRSYKGFEIIGIVSLVVEYKYSHYCLFRLFGTSARFKIHIKTNHNHVNPEYITYSGNCDILEESWGKIENSINYFQNMDNYKKWF